MNANNHVPRDWCDVGAKLGVSSKAPSGEVRVLLWGLIEYVGVKLRG